MPAHGRLRARRWVLLALGLALVAGHGVVLRYASHRLALSAVALAGVVALLVITHLGLGRVFRGVLRRRPRR